MAGSSKLARMSSTSLWAEMPMAVSSSSVRAEEGSFSASFAPFCWSVRVASARISSAALVTVPSSSVCSSSPGCWSR